MINRSQQTFALSQRRFTFSGAIDMKAIQLVSIATLAVCLSACGTVMTKPESTFLTSYAGLTGDDGTASDRLHASVDIDPTRIVLGDFSWRAAGSDFPVAEQEQLLTVLRQSVQQQIAQLPASPGGRPAVLRAAITRVATVSPTLNAVSTLLIIVPIDRGGAAVEIEAFDPDTGTQLAALRLGYYAPLSDLKARFRKFAPAEIALKKAAAEFVPLLQPEVSTLMVSANRVKSAKPYSE
jgi:hypothetical protein